MKTSHIAVVIVVLFAFFGTAQAQWPFAINDCGYLVQGVEAGCVLFDADEGGSYLIFDLGDFSVGDYVHVSGVVNPACITFCMQGDGCIEGATVTTCQTLFEECGEIATAGACPRLFLTSAGYHSLSDYQAFNVGAKVCVTGTLDPDCQSLCDVIGCVEVTAIAERCCEIRGDVNHSGIHPDVGDLVYLVNYMFLGGPEPPCMGEADINADGQIRPDISDLVTLVRFMFGGGPALPDC